MAADIYGGRRCLPALRGVSLPGAQARLKHRINDRRGLLARCDLAIGRLAVELRSLGEALPRSSPGAMAGTVRVLMVEEAAGNAALWEEARTFIGDNMDVVKGAAADDAQSLAEFLGMAAGRSDTVSVPGDGSCILHAMKGGCAEMGVAWRLGDTALGSRATIAAELRSEKLLFLFKSVYGANEGRPAMERLLAQCESSTAICDESLYLVLAHK